MDKNVDGFDTHAFAWILTRCSLWETLRMQIGLPPEVDRSKLERVGELWGDVQVAMISDRSEERKEDNSTTAKMIKSSIENTRLLLDPRRQQLGEKSKTAMKALLEFLAALWPQRFSHAALARKFWNWAISTVVNLVLLFFILPVYDLPQPVHGYALVFTLLFGLLSFAFAFQYNRATRLFSTLGIPR